MSDTISISKAIEVFTNPKCLIFTVFIDEKNGKYGFTIALGKEYYYRKLFSTPKGISEDLKEVLRLVKRTLNMIWNGAAKELNRKKSPIYRFNNPDMDEISPENVLTEEHVSWIILELEDGQIADTSKILIKNSGPSQTKEGVK